MKASIKPLLPVLLLLILPVVAHAQFLFMTNDSAIIITKYTGSGGAVTIPDTTNGLPVTLIGANAFYNCQSVTNVSIGTNVTTIGDSAFDSCTSLTGVSISNGVTSIGATAFYFCTSLSDVTLPNTVLYIGGQAFSDCYSLTNVTIPDGVTIIDGGAFAYCLSLTTLWIPESVTVIGDSAFSGCTSLSAISVDEQNSSYSSVDGVLFDRAKTTLIQCPAAKTGSYSVPDTVTYIGSGAFYQCVLTNVTLPNSVTEIGALAFWQCSSLTNVSIPDSVTGIEPQAFYECASLRAITVDEQNLAYSSVDGVLFDKDQTVLIQCPGAQAGSYTVTNSVTNICSFAFSSCANLTNVMIGSGVTSIGDYAFVSCASLTSVYFNTNAPSLGSSVFWASDNATVYYLPRTMGWYTPFGGAPAVLWNPTIQTTNANFGMQTNRFGFTIIGTTNIPIAVVACTNPANPTWLALQTCTLTNGSIYFSDPDWTNHPTRLYRLRSP